MATNENTTNPANPIPPPQSATSVQPHDPFEFAFGIGVGVTGLIIGISVNVGSTVGILWTLVGALRAVAQLGVLVICASGEGDPVNAGTGVPGIVGAV